MLGMKKALSGGLRRKERKSSGAGILMVMITMAVIMVVGRGDG